MADMALKGGWIDLWVSDLLLVISHDSQMELLGSEAGSLQLLSNAEKQSAGEEHSLLAFLVGFPMASY